MSETSLAGKTAVITGATRGIGKAIALELARSGATLCLLGRDQSALQSVAAATSPASARIFPADLSNDDSLAQVSAQLNQLETIDVLIHNAGLVEPGAFQSASVATLDALYRVNLRLPFALTQALLPKLLTNKGQIAFINSTFGLIARANFSQYVATKFALKGLADSLRDEVHTAGVRVITVYPGGTATDMQVAIHAYHRRDYQPETLMQPEDVAQAVVSTLKTPRTAEITDLQIHPMLR